MKHFPYPITLEAVAEFCHPDPANVFGQPFRWGDDWAVANGFAVMRVRSFLDCDREAPEAVARIEALPWSFFAPRRDDELGTAGSRTDAKAWGKLDDKRPALWKHGKSPFWQQTAAGAWFRRTLRRVEVGESGVQVTVPGLQLVSKLPRAEVFTGRTALPWCFFRFNGGEGMLRGFEGKDRRPCGYWIFKGRTDFFQ